LRIIEADENSLGARNDSAGSIELKASEPPVGVSKNGVGSFLKLMSVAEEEEAFGISEVGELGMEDRGVESSVVAAGLRAPSPVEDGRDVGWDRVLAIGESSQASHSFDHEQVIGAGPGGNPHGIGEGEVGKGADGLPGTRTTGREGGEDPVEIGGDRNGRVSARLLGVAPSYKGCQDEKEAQQLQFSADSREGGHIRKLRDGGRGGKTQAGVKTDDRSARGSGRGEGH